MDANNIMELSNIEKNQIESIDYLVKIKSSYILKHIFKNLQKNKFFLLIKYNKVVQKRLNININDYNECCKIEIEIELKSSCCNIINVPEEYKPYYHIYINNNEKDIKDNDLNVNGKIEIKIDYQVKSLNELFKNCEKIKSIYFKKFYRTNINNMSKMFYGCSSLKELNLSNFNTKNVTNMSHMFYNCSSIEQLNISNFNTNKVKNMSYMLYGCQRLLKLNLSNFNTDNVTNMSRMFYGCSSMKTLNISNFNFDKIKDMSWMFDLCVSLKELDNYNFNTNELNKIYYGMFHKCKEELKKKVISKNKFIRNEAFL